MRRIGGVAERKGGDRLEGKTKGGGEEERRSRGGKRNDRLRRIGEEGWERRMRILGKEDGRWE